MKSTKKAKKVIDPFKIKRKSNRSETANTNDILAHRIFTLLTELEAAKSIYRRYDELMEELLSSGFTEIAVGNQRIRLKDNFANKNTAWKSTAVRRFEVEVV